MQEQGEEERDIAKQREADRDIDREGHNSLQLERDIIFFKFSAFWQIQTSNGSTFMSGIISNLGK